ncbi:uncharacterized protein LOC118756226 [Rhagoletis pomonella]|uniref:uncharacterized protein LOC118756226 n=1 Tax=Rhagoletis pomonella TaxID=28610 RepID=UPI001786405B|nr:uncharacterized protein LOC118756226 [Rhagoletis pomonella]
MTERSPQKKTPREQRAEDREQQKTGEPNISSHQQRAHVETETAARMIAEMKREFQRQMFAMQNLITKQQEQTKASVAALQKELQDVTKKLAAISAGTRDATPKSTAVKTIPPGIVNSYPVTTPISTANTATGVSAEGTVTSDYATNLRVAVTTSIAFATGVNNCTGGIGVPSQRGTADPCLGDVFSSTSCAAMGAQHHLVNSTLVSELVSKLPMTRRMQWAEKCMELGRAPSIVDFGKWLTCLRRLANMVTDSLPPPQVSINSRARGNVPGVNKDKYSMFSLARRKCIICEGDCQSLASCDKFINQNKQGLGQGMSLNDALLPGPGINQPLIDVLFKFRKAPIAVTGDIAEMFLQIETREVDQDCQRFL